MNKMKIIIVLALTAFIFVGCEAANKAVQSKRESDKNVITIYDNACPSAEMLFAFYEDDKNVYYFGSIPNMYVEVNGDYYEMVDAFYIGLLTLEDLDLLEIKYYSESKETSTFEIMYSDIKKNVIDKYENLSDYKVVYDFIDGCPQDDQSDATDNNSSVSTTNDK